MIDAETLQAYLKLLRCSGSIGVRDFQRLMNYRSPGKAKFILDKLTRLGLVERLENGEYRVKSELPFYLSSYMVLKGMLLPRVLVFTIFTSIFALTYIILVKIPIDTTIALIIVLLPYWIESTRTLLLLRRLQKKTRTILT